MAEPVRIAVIDSGVFPGHPHISASRLGENGVHYASGYPRPIEGVPLKRNLHGIRFATAQVTGLIAAGLL